LLSSIKGIVFDCSIIVKLDV